MHTWQRLKTPPIFLPAIDCIRCDAEAAREISAEFTQSATEAVVPHHTCGSVNCKKWRMCSSWASMWTVLVSQTYSVVVVVQKVHGELVSWICQFLVQHGLLWSFGWHFDRSHRGFCVLWGYCVFCYRLWIVSRLTMFTQKVWKR